MAIVSELIDSHLDELRKEDERPFKYKEIILPEIERNEEGVPLDMQIEATLQQLEKVKQQHRYIKTKELFLQRILQSRTVEEAYPSSNEMAQLEMALAGEKQKLRSIKAARGESEKRLAAAAADLGSAITERKNARGEVESLIQRAKSSAALQVVRDALEAQDEGQLDELIQNAQEFDERSCKLILNDVRMRRAQLEEEELEQSQRVDSVNAEVEGLKKNVEELQDSNARLKMRISESNKENSGQAEVRKECEMQEELGSMLEVLTGVRVTEMRSNGITFGIKSHVLMPRGNESDSTGLTEYKLEVEFGHDELGKTVIAFMHLEPPHVRVGDIREEQGLSMEDGVREVCTRLTKFLKEKHQE